MLAKQNRLPAYLIPQLLKKGRRYSASLFTLVAASKRTGLSGSLPRFAFIVSARIDKRAAQRNKLKRRLREAVRTSLETIEKRKDFVFIAKKPLSQASFEELKKEVQKVFLKAGEN